MALLNHLPNPTYLLYYLLQKVFSLLINQLNPTLLLNLKLLLPIQLKPPTESYGMNGGGKAFACGVALSIPETILVCAPSYTSYYWMTQIVNPLIWRNFLTVLTL